MFHDPAEFHDLPEADWDDLLFRIAHDKCTPFLGAGACVPSIKQAGDIAEDWAEQYGYPLSDRRDLARVAQYRAVIGDNVRPKEDLATVCANALPPDFRNPCEIHGLLAELPLSTYMTTNYDDFMEQALVKVGKKPRPELCPWNRYVEDMCPSVFARDPTYRPDPWNPLVYHLHGAANEPQSMVLTEDDYLDFLVWFSREWANRDRRLFPAPVIKAIAGSSLLFIGYSRTDWSFRVLFRALVGSLLANRGSKSVAVQLSPVPEDAKPEVRKRAEKYLESYFMSMQMLPVRVFWGKAEKFTELLRNRWKDFHAREKPG
jgi:hypothetical protein